MKYSRPIILSSPKKIPPGTKRLDMVARSQKELFVIRNPQFKGKSFEGQPAWKSFLAEIKGRSQWTYFPEQQVSVRLLDEKLYFELRTARNKNLITGEEQMKYRAMKVGIAGLSVGSSIASSLALTGGPRVMKIADFDTLDPSNLNRIRASVWDLGRRKIDLIARDVWGTDPFAELILWDKGVSEETIGRFIAHAPRLDIMIDEMDSLAVKVAARIVARKNRIPVLMATDNGDGVMLDVERFDDEPRRALFHGVVPNLTLARARKAKGAEWLALVKKIIGEAHMPERHRASLREVGKTLAGVPQLGTDALLAGAAMSLAVRKIACGAPLPSGKYIFDMGKGLRQPMSLGS